MEGPGLKPFPITATVISGPGLTFTFSWTTDPLPNLDVQPSKAYFIDVQVVRSAITGSPKVIITTNRYTFTRVWEREVRTT